MIYTLSEAAGDLSGTLTFRDDGCTRMGVRKRDNVVMGFGTPGLGTYVFL